MRKIIGWILGAIGVVLLGIFGWLYFTSNKVIKSFSDDE